MPVKTEAEVDPTNVFRHYYKRHKLLQYEDISRDLTPEILSADDLASFQSPYYHVRVNDGDDTDKLLSLASDSSEELKSLTARFNEFMSLPGKRAVVDITKSGSENIPKREVGHSNEREQRPASGTAPVAIQVKSIPKCITVDELPGLRIIPNYLPEQVQQRLVESVIEDYIPDECHLSNLHLHYKLPKRLRIFPEYITKDEEEKEGEGEFYEGDPTVKNILHKMPQKAATSILAIREKQLRWITLGGQYNWTTKIYPTFEPHTTEFPDFPANLSRLLRSDSAGTAAAGSSSRLGSSSSYHHLDFDILPQAAIVNFYSPGDILSPHQDVAELCGNDLLSLSIGCSAIFYIGLVKSRTERCQLDNDNDNDDDDTDQEDWLVPPLAVLVKSGDILIMGGKSRFAFHGIGKVFAGTCPEYLQHSAPAVSSNGSSIVDKWDLYGSWMRNKRVNINVRQMLKSI